MISPIFLRNHFLLLAFLGSQFVAAQSNLQNLWITEVTPSTGQIEVTNVSDEAITTPRTLPFCHRFNYQTGVPANTTFEPGQSRIFTVRFDIASSSDLWLYSDRQFSNANSLLNGLLWGPNSPVGRTSLAVSGGNWDSSNSSVPTPPPGQSLLLVGPDPFSAANWAIGAPNLGQFGLEVDIAVTSDEISLSWSGRPAPYQVLASSDLENFAPISGILTEPNFVLPVPTGERQFYRIAEVDLTATFEVTLQSDWSSEEFSNVPANRSFSSLVGATHNSDFALWNEGAIASTPFAQLARDGAPQAAASMVNQAIAQGSAGALLDGAAITNELGSCTIQFTVDREHSLLSFASALQPTPDWFVGLASFDLLDSSGAWIDSLDVALPTYDAGVDSGDSFQSGATPTQPVDTISLLGENPNFTPSSAPESGGDTTPVATFQIRRIAE